jgi:hypothetical protein
VLITHDDGISAADETPGYPFGGRGCVSSFSFTDTVRLTVNPHPSTDSRHMVYITRTSRAFDSTYIATSLTCSPKEKTQENYNQDNVDDTLPALQ